MRKPTNTRFTPLLALLAMAALAPSVWANGDWDQGVTAYQAGKHEEAAAAFARYVETAPDAYQGHQMLGTALLNTGLLNAGDAQKAAAHLRRADELHSGQPAILLTLAKALLAIEKPEDACVVLDRVDAATVSAQFQVALYKLRAKAACSGDRLGDLEQLAKVTGTASAWATYGVALKKANRFTDAASAFAKAVEIEPTDAKIRRAQVAALVDQALAAEAPERLALYTVALEPAALAFEANPNRNTTALYADVLINAQRYSQAAELLSTATVAAVATKGDWLLTFLSGRALLLDQKYVAAEGQLTMALGLATDAHQTTQTSEQLGFIFEMQKRYDEAISAYTAANRTDDVARVEANRLIALENAKAEEFNKQRADLIEQKRQADEAAVNIRTGGPPPTPS